MIKRIRRLLPGMIAFHLLVGTTLLSAQAAKVVPTTAPEAAIERTLNDYRAKEALQIRKIRLVWPAVPNAVMYELVITKGQSAAAQDIVTTKDKIYANGYEVDTSLFNVVGEDLHWKVQALDVDGRPLADFTEAKPLLEGEVNPQAPLTTTEFEKMDYTPLYPVYSWIPYLQANEYEIQIFYDSDNNPQTPDELIKTDWVRGGSSYDYYDETAYAKAGTYWWQVRAKDAATNPISQWSKRSYFSVTSRAVKVAALGDSITHGGGAVSTPPGYLMYNWESYTGLPVLNLGFSGNTVEAMNSRFEADVLPFKPKILVIMGGINNIRVGDSAEQVIQGLSMLQYKCIINHIIPVFVTITPINPPDMKNVAGLIAAPDWKNAQRKINDWVASQPYYVDVTPRLTDWRGFLSSFLTTDGLHPDMQGKRIIGQTIGGYIREKFGGELGFR